MDLVKVPIYDDFLEFCLRYFDNHGRRIPLEGHRVFGESRSDYYRLPPFTLDYGEILSRLNEHKGDDLGLSAEVFEEQVHRLLLILRESQEYANLTKGIYIPFAVRRTVHSADLGFELENYLLKGVQASFNAKCPHAHFKAVLQGDSVLAGNLLLSPQSRYHEFIKSCEYQTTVGIYFPQALQEFDVESQRLQMQTLPDLPGAGVCLSGGIDVCAALTGVPSLLISEEFYTPILLMSSYVHVDPRLVLLIKAYGPHMEFWCMSQMMTKKVTQVSEQWSGGLTVYNSIVN